MNSGDDETGTSRVVSGPARAVVSGVRARFVLMVAACRTLGGGQASPRFLRAVTTAINLWMALGLWFVLAWKSTICQVYARRPSGTLVFTDNPWNYEELETRPLQCNTPQCRNYYYVNMTRLQAAVVGLHTIHRK